MPSWQAYGCFPNSELEEPLEKYHIFHFPDPSKNKARAEKMATQYWCRVYSFKFQLL